MINIKIKKKMKSNKIGFKKTLIFLCLVLFLFNINGLINKLSIRDVKIDNSVDNFFLKTSDDNYEFNDVPSDAFNLSSKEGVWLEDINGLGIQADDDWYEIYVKPGEERVRIDLRFVNSEGDIDMYMIDAYENDVTSSNSADDNEHINCVVSSGVYYINVWGSNAGNNYNLWWEDIAPNSDDYYEENDVLSSAYDLSSDEQSWLSDLQGLGVKNDVDWYKIYVESGKEWVIIELQCLFDEGDMDLELYNPSETLVAASWSITDNERINCIVPSSGNYYIKILEENAGNTYDLWWNTSDPLGFIEDNYEENDYYYNSFDLSSYEKVWLDSINGFGIQNDHDLYKIQIDSGEERLIVNVLFNHTEGNIDIVVFRTSSPIFVIENNSITDNEYINCIVPTAGVYYIGIKGDNNSTKYNLWWNDEDPDGPTPVLEYSSHIIDDDSIGFSLGDGDSILEAGETVELSITLVNTGTGPTTGVSAILSTSDALIIILDNYAYYPDIAEDEIKQSVDNYSLVIASSHSSGNVIFTIEINSNEGSWTDEFNVYINARPDLIERGNDYSEFSPTVVMPGKIVFNVSCEIFNLGGVASGSFNISYYASLDYLITKDDHFLGNKTIPSIDTNAYAEARWSGNFPTMDEGTYYIGWIIDNAEEIDEANESNNIGVKTDYQLNVVIKADLIDGGDNYADFNTTAIIPELEYLKVWCVINNTGISPSGVFNVSFYLSTDTTLSISDYFLGKITVLNIDADDYINCTWIGNISNEISRRSYYILWNIDCDEVVDEFLENNNIGIKTSKQLIVLNNIVSPTEEDGDDNDDDDETSTIAGYDFYFFGLVILINVLLFIKKIRRTIVH